MRYPPDSTRLCTELSKSRTEPFEPKYQVKQWTSRHHHIPAPDYNRSTLSPQGEAKLGIRELSYLSSTDISNRSQRSWVPRPHDCHVRDIPHREVVHGVGHLHVPGDRARQRDPGVRLQPWRRISADHPLAIVKGKLIGHELAKRSRASA